METTGRGSAALKLEAELKRAIVTLELRPGARLSEAELAERHGVSRQPAREALISLATQKTDASARSTAFSALGRSKDPKAVAFIDGILKK